MINYKSLCGDCYLWLAGAVNYLWPAVLFVYCIILLEKYSDDLTYKRALLISIPLLFSSLTNENTGGMLLVFMILTLIEKKTGFSKKHLILCIFILAGMAVIVAAPGNYARYHFGAESATASISEIFDSFESYYYLYFEACLPAIILTVFQLVICHEKNQAAS